MLRMIGLTLLGFLSFFGSVTFGYFYLQNLGGSSTHSWLFALASGVCLIVSAVSMLLAGRSKDIYSPTMPKEPVTENDPSITTIGLQNAIEKNNEIVTQWRKTNHMKDKMTMVKISANAQQKPKL